MMLVYCPETDPEIASLEKTVDFYGSEAIQAAIEFYRGSPDGQFDAMVADLLEKLAVVFKS